MNEVPPGFAIRVGLLLIIVVSAGTFVCVLALPAHSLHSVPELDATE